MRAALAAGSITYTISFRQSILPWADSPADVARYRRIRNRVLITAALLCLLFLLMPRPQHDRTQVAELPPQLAKIVLERETPAPPPPPPVKVEKKEEQPAAAHPKKPDDPKPETVKQPVPEARVPVPNKPPGEVDGARRRAAGVGLLAMKDQIAEIRGAPVAVQLNQDIKQGKGVGAGTGAGVGAGVQRRVGGERQVRTHEGAEAEVHDAAAQRVAVVGGSADTRRQRRQARRAERRYQSHNVPSRCSRFTGRYARWYGCFAASASSISTPCPDTSPGCMKPASKR